MTRARRPKLPPPVLAVRQEEVDALEVGFGVPDVGWIELTIPHLLGENRIHCSQTDDPFPNFIAWLEAIVDGAPASAWQVSENGRSSHLVFLSATGFVGDDASHIVISRTADALLGVAACVIGRRALVKAFYEAFRRMTQDPAYDAYHWEPSPKPVE